MKIKMYILLAGIAVYAYACQKEMDKTDENATDTEGTDDTDSTNSSNTITGTWKFVSIEAQTQSISEITVGNTTQKLAVFLNYTTTDNSGTIVINDSAMNCSAIAYKISSEIKTYRYKNDVVTDSLTLPYIVTFPATDSYTPYTLIGTDSIFFRKGGFTNISAARFKVNPSAAQIQLKDSVLSFIQPLTKDTTESIEGIDYHTIVTGTAILTLNRQ
ncbi:hypothetical protein [Parafilimonas sp.]|uniref:hypothetical protein n=1 Tax=Parafilimonas sp. TaxID=1969739 RepID=UPI0039E51408